MRKFINLMVVAVLAFVIVGCDNKPEFDNDVSNLKSAQKVVQESRGVVIHEGIYATKVVGRSIKVSDGIYSYSFIVNSQSRAPAMIGLTCFDEYKISVVAHSILDNDGNAIREESTLSIMKYRKGIKDIREMDENGTPVFSTANGDTDFVKAIKDVAKLDPDTPVAFTIENFNTTVNLWTTVGWSPLMTAGELTKAAERLPWKYCEGRPIPQNEPEAIGGFTNAELMEAGKEMLTKQ